MKQSALTPPVRRRPSPFAEERNLEQLEIDLLLEGILRKYGYDFRNYARASLTRRVRHFRDKENLSTTSSVLDAVLHDAECMARFIATLSVHVTAMFRDPEFYLALRRQAVPMLRTFPFIRIWHAGCSTGEEVYSLAILLAEEGLYERSRIYATDISDALLGRAQSGIFPLASMREYTQNYLRAGGREDFSKYYVSDHRSAIFRESLRRNLIFSHHNLVSDGPFNEFNLILCRNVMIYFDAELRERVHGLLHDSLSRYGLLGVGKKESLRHSRFEAYYAELPGDVRLYRRLA